MDQQQFDLSLMPLLTFSSGTAAVQHKSVRRAVLQSGQSAGQLRIIGLAGSPADKYRIVLGPQPMDNAAGELYQKVQDGSGPDKWQTFQSKTLSTSLTNSYPSTKLSANSR